MSYGLEEEIKQLSKEKAALRRQIEKLKGKMEALRLELAEIRERLDDENDRYNVLKEHAAGLKEERSRTSSKLKEIRERLAELRRISRSLQMSMGPERAAELEDDIAKLEWELQTKPGTEIDEKKVMGSLTRLSSELASWKKAYRVKSEMEILTRRVKTLGNKHYEVKSELDSVYDELAVRREHIRKLLEAKKQLIEEMRGLKDDIRELEDRLVRVEADIRARRLQVREEHEDKRRKEEERILAEKRERALERLKHNEPLSWDDLKVLYSPDET